MRRREGRKPINECRSARLARLRSHLVSAAFRLSDPCARSCRPTDRPTNLQEMRHAGKASVLCLIDGDAGGAQPAPLHADAAVADPALHEHAWGRWGGGISNRATERQPQWGGPALHTLLSVILPSTIVWWLQPRSSSSSSSRKVSGLTPTAVFALATPYNHVLTPAFVGAIHAGITGCGTHAHILPLVRNMQRSQLGYDYCMCFGHWPKLWCQSMEMVRYPKYLGLWGVARRGWRKSQNFLPTTTTEVELACNAILRA
jgi:hypothetical protein